MPTLTKMTKYIDQSICYTTPRAISYARILHHHLYVPIFLSLKKSIIHMESGWWKLYSWYLPWPTWSHQICKPNLITFVWTSLLNWTPYPQHSLQHFLMDHLQLHISNIIVCSFPLPACLFSPFRFSHLGIVMRASLWGRGAPVVGCQGSWAVLRVLVPFRVAFCMFIFRLPPCNCLYSTWLWLPERLWDHSNGDWDL